MRADGPASESLVLLLLGIKCSRQSKATRSHARLPVLSVAKMKMIRGILISIDSIVTFHTPFPTPKVVALLYGCPYKYTELPYCG